MLAKTKSEKIRGVLALVVAATLFACMGILVRNLNHGLTILQQVYLRVGLATLFCAVLFYRDIDYTKWLKIPKKDWVLLFTRAISFYLLAITLVSYAFTIGSYSNISFLQALPFGAILGFILFKEKVTRLKILFILLAFLGVFLISVKDYTNLFSWGFAELLSIISCFFFSFGYIARKWQSNFLTNKEMTLLVFIIATILVALTSFLFGEGFPHASWTATLTSSLVISGLFNVGNVFLTSYGFEKVEAVIASNILTLESVFALFIGILLYKEIPNAKEIIGGLLIVFSVYHMNKL